MTLTLYDVAYSQLAPAPLQDLWRDLESLQDEGSPRSLAEIYHDILHAMADVHAQFAHGLLSLQERAQAETLYVRCCRMLRAELDSANRAHREIIDELNENKMMFLKKRNSSLKDKLNAASKLIEKIMSEGGALLKQYEISYSDLSRGSELGSG